MEHVSPAFVGKRLDFQELLIFTDEGRVAATVATDSLDSINDVFSRMRQGEIEGRVVLDFRQQSS